MQSCGAAFHHNLLDCCWSRVPASNHTFWARKRHSKIPKRIFLWQQQLQSCIQQSWLQWGCTNGVSLVLFCWMHGMVWLPKGVSSWWGPRCMCQWGGSTFHCECSQWQSGSCKNIGLHQVMWHPLWNCCWASEAEWCPLLPWNGVRWGKQAPESGLWTF